MARAEQLAQELDAKAVPWELFPEHLVHADIVISSTSAPQPIIVPADSAECHAPPQRPADVFYRYCRAARR